MQSDPSVPIDPDPSIGQQIDRMDRTIQNQQFLIQSLIKSFLKNDSLISSDDSFKKELNQINQRYEDINEQIILETSTFSAYDTAFSHIQNRLNKIEAQLRQRGNEENAEEETKDLSIENMKVDIKCLKEQFTNFTESGETSSSKNTFSILKTTFMAKFKKLKNHLKAYQESTNKAISSLRADLENLEMNGQEYHQEFTRLNSKIQNFQITLNYLRDQLNISDDQVNSSDRNSQIQKEIESMKESIESIQQRSVQREDVQDYENKLNSLREKLAQFPLVAAQQEKCSKDVFKIQNEIDQLKNSQFNSVIAISAEYQSKLNSLIESQQKDNETLKRVRKSICTLKSEIQELKQNNVVTREIQINEDKSDHAKKTSKCKEIEAKVNKINDDINHIHEDIESIYNKMNDYEGISLPNSNSSNDFVSMKKEIKKLKNEISTLKSNSNESGIENQLIQRINQISSEQALLIGQYNGLVSYFDQIKKELENIEAKQNDNDEKNNSEIESLNRKVENLSNDIMTNGISAGNAENPISYQYKERSISLNNDDDQDNNTLTRNISSRIQAIETNLKVLHARTESGILSQNKLITQFNELVHDLRKMKETLSEVIVQNQQRNSQISRKSSSSLPVSKTKSGNIDDDDGEIDIMISLDGDNNLDGQIIADDDLVNEVNSLKSIVSNIQSKVNQIELSTSFLNKVRTEVNQLENKIGDINLNSPDVSSSAFKNQSNQISKLQRQYHHLKRNFEKHLVLSANTGAQEGSFLDDEDDEESDNSLSNLINANATAGTKMQNSIFDSIEKRINEMKTENKALNSNLERKVEELERKVKKMTSKSSRNSDFDNSPDEDLSERIRNLENSLQELMRSNKALTKDNKNIRLIINQIQDSDNAGAFSNSDKARSKQGNFVEREVKKIPSPKKAIGSPKSENDSDDVDKKLSQLYVQVNSYYSNIGSLSKSLKELTHKFEVLRNDVNSLLLKSPSVNNRKINKNERHGKNDEFMNDPDYDQYDEENE